MIQWKVVYDFESGMLGWNRTGTAFNNQPTRGDYKHKGKWLIRSSASPTYQAGSIQGEEATGTMTSPPFKILGNRLRFLIGGGCNINSERVELLINGEVVDKATGKCTETMVAKYWNVEKYEDQRGQLRLVDNSSGRWGHINFDHLEMFGR